MVEMIETAPRRACGLCWRRFWRLRAGETAAFAAMATAERQGDRDGVAASAIVVADTCLQVCVSQAATWRAAESKVRFLGIMIPWAWPRHPALGAVLEAARRAESVIWGV